MKSTDSGPMALHLVMAKGLLIALAVNASATEQLSRGTRSQPSVMYITSVTGNFFKAPGKSIYPSDAFALTNNVDSCKDRNLKPCTP